MPEERNNADAEQEEVSLLHFEQIKGQTTAGDKNPERFSDVPLKIAIELGRINMSVRDILNLREGSIIETRKLSGQPMEVMVNDRLFGRGEVVVVGDNLAIRLNDLKKPDLT